MCQMFQICDGQIDKHNLAVDISGFCKWLQS